MEPVLPRFAHSIETATTDAAQERYQFALRALLAHLPEDVPPREVPDDLRQALAGQGLTVKLWEGEAVGLGTSGVHVYDDEGRHQDRYTTLAFQAKAATYEEAYRELIRGIRRWAKE